MLDSGVKEDIVVQYFSSNEEPFDEIQWNKRKAEIKKSNGETVFVQEDVEAPISWSDNAVVIAASKYFQGSLEKTTKKSKPKDHKHVLDTMSEQIYGMYRDLGYGDSLKRAENFKHAISHHIDLHSETCKPLEEQKRETSVKEMIHRVAATIASWGLIDGYFSTEESVIFRKELTHLLVHQYAAFNSPVWFNVGTQNQELPQGSACFIQSVEDDIDSIGDLMTREMHLFKYGSGTGTNFSALRSKHEFLSGGGKPSGPVSFMKGLDTNAGIIKSGGRTRRSAKMAVLNIDHPDIDEFIQVKSKEEAKARTLIAAGYDDHMDGEAYTTVSHQNTNYSVRVTDDFMVAVEEDLDWNLLAITNKKPIKTLKARDIWKMICECAHDTGDPGIQFDTITNEFHTFFICLRTGRLFSSSQEKA